MYTRYTRYGDPVRLSSESRAPDPTWSTLALAGATGKTNSASTGLLTEQDAPFRVREALAANGSRTPALLPPAGSAGVFGNRPCVASACGAVF